MNKWVIYSNGTDTKIHGGTVSVDSTGLYGTNILLRGIYPRRACFQCSADKWIESGDNFTFGTTVFNKTGGLVVSNSGSTFTVNYSGYLMISANVWLGGISSTARPWVQLIQNSTVIADCIGDSSANYVTFSIANRIVSVSSGDVFRMYASVNDGTFALDAGTGGHRSSYITFELI